MPIYKLSAPETVRLLSGHILPRNASNFTHIHLDFKKKFPERTLAYTGREGKGKGWEGIKGFIPLKEVQRERTGEGREGWEWKRRGGASGMRVLFQGLKGG